MSALEITVDAVKEQMKRGEALFFLEVRPGGDKDLAVMKVRGARRLADDDVQHHLDEIPRERKVVLYSIAANDEPAVRAARLLLKQGFTNVQVLTGGFQAYLTAGLPVEEIGAARNMTRARGL
jgi:rhodanese-related sulfurtransferase